MPADDVSLGSAQSVMERVLLLPEDSPELPHERKLECRTALQAALVYLANGQMEPAGTVSRCSFRGKSKEAVPLLISAPPSFPRAYLCNECVAVCDRIVDDRPFPAGQKPVAARKGCLTDLGEWESGNRSLTVAAL